MCGSEELSWGSVEREPEVGGRKGVSRRNSTYKGQNLQGALVDLAPAVRHDTNDNLLPAVRTPHLGTVPAAQVCNVLDDAGE